MGSAAYGLTVGLPSGSVSEPYSISVTQSGLGIGFNNNYNPSAGTVSVSSYDNPLCTIGARGAFTVSGTGYAYSLYGYVTSVDSAAGVGGAVTYTTSINLVTQP